MIEITIDKTNKIVDIRGHAGFAEAGKDVVCSAISTLFFTLIHNLQNNCGKFKFDYGTSGAYIKLVKHDTDSVGAFRTVCSGFELVAHEYPDNVKIKEASLK